MYNVEKFAVLDEALLISIIEKYPFATVVTVGRDGAPSINHLPVVAQRSSDGRLKLSGHMSRRNSQWLEMQTGSPVTIAFHGPHTYINPNWYVEDDVPTWNYIVVQAAGRASIVDGLEGLMNILRLTSDKMNGIYTDQWDFYLPADLRNAEEILNAIVGFEIYPSELIGKFKLNQNRSVADRAGVIAGLGSRSDEGSLAIAEWMKVKD